MPESSRSTRTACTTAIELMPVTGFSFPTATLLLAAVRQIPTAIVHPAPGQGGDGRTVRLAGVDQQMTEGAASPARGLPEGRLRIAGHRDSECYTLTARLSR